MMLLSFAGMFITAATRNKIRKLTPYAVALVGVLLVFRGLSLGIPYISPQLQTLNVVGCH